MPSEVAQTIGAPDDLAGFLRGRELLLLLDNFEHLLDAAPDVVRLLASSTRTFVFSSRAVRRLRVSGEQEFRLEPLPSGDASALFVERAHAVGKELTADPPSKSICRRLDGLPLAIELAAARTKLLGPEAPSRAPRLGSSAAYRRSSRRTRAAAHAARDHRVELRPARLRGQELFARLAVFAGSFPLAAAEEVCEVDLDALAALVDSSLLKPIGDDRFLMLETIREYAREQLDERGCRRAPAAPRCALRCARRGGVRTPLRRRGRVVGSGSRWTRTISARRSTGWPRTMRSGARARRCARLVLALSRTAGGRARPSVGLARGVRQWSLHAPAHSPRSAPDGPTRRRRARPSAARGGGRALA